MLKCVEIFCSPKRFRSFALNGWSNVRQRHVTCVDFADNKKYDCQRIQLTFTCSKSTIGALEKEVKYIQS